MSNINDYVLWRGDITFDNDEFNEIDQLILSRISYMPYKLINMSVDETIQTVSKKMQVIPDSKFSFNGDKQLITNLGKSERYKDLKLTDYEENIDEKIEVQFSAITIHISKKELFVSFNGTDNSLNGWKEDFNMSYMQHVPCQLEGVKYLNEIAKKYPAKIRIGGHSKGGNIALYSAIFCNKKAKKKIISVRCCDAPGFEKEIFDEGFEEIKDKTLNYIPQDSVIGRMIEHKEKQVVIHSTAKGLMQHDIFSWEVIGKSLVPDKLTENSDVINKTLKGYLQNTSVEQRKLLVDVLFEVLYSSEADSLKELKSVWAKKIPDMLKKYKSIDDNEKREANTAVGELIKSMGNSVIKMNKDAIEARKNTINKKPKLKNKT